MAQKEAILPSLMVLLTLGCGHPIWMIGRTMTRMGRSSIMMRVAGLTVGVWNYNRMGAM
jgi:hypothetical protein